MARARSFHPAVHRNQHKWKSWTYSNTYSYQYGLLEDGCLLAPAHVSLYPRFRRWQLARQVDISDVPALWTTYGFSTADTIMLMYCFTPPWIQLWVPMLLSLCTFKIKCSFDLLCSAYSILPYLATPIAAQDKSQVAVQQTEQARLA